MPVFRSDLEESFLDIKDIKDDNKCKSQVIIKIKVCNKIHKCMVKYIQFKKEIKKVCISWLYIIVLVSNLFFVQPDFLKTSKIWCMEKLPCLFKNRLGTKMLRVHLLRFLTIKTPWALTALAPFSIIIL